MEVLISKALIKSDISYNEFVLVNNLLREYGYMKEEIENLKTSRAHQISICGYILL